MYRTKSNGPGHLHLDEMTTGMVGCDGRINVKFHQNITSLASWVRRVQLKRSPTESSASSFTLRGDDESEREKSDEELLASPRLNIAIHIVGSRGDVQPFIPIAKLLQAAPFNHRVRICTHPTFKDFVEGQGIEFFSIGGDPEALMAYMVKNPGLLPSKESRKAGDIGKRRAEMWEIINGCWRSCIEAGNGLGAPLGAAYVPEAKDLFLADAIIANPPSMAHLHCAEKLGIPLHMVFTMPWSPTEAFSHPLAAMSYGQADRKVANYLSFIMMELLTWQGLGDLISKFRRQKLGLDPISPLWGFHLLPRLRVPFTYLWSKSLIPKPADWGKHIDITGFSFLELASTYTPPEDLAAFLAAGEAPIYIGFGSIVVDEPEKLTKLIFAAVKKAGVRAIVSKGWSGVGGEDVPSNVYLIGNCPHDWLFQRVSAVVHHGGAGTTAAGIAAGRPTVVVPFFGDQPFWGQMVARAGAGPEPVPFTAMTEDTLAASIKFALKPEVQEGAKEMAKSIAQENGAEDTARLFQKRLLKADHHLECELCPGHLASWKHKKTGTLLSGLAITVLIDKAIIKPNEVKLLEHKSWYVDEGAEHPLVGVVAAGSGFVRDVAIAGSDYSKALHSKPERKKSVPRIVHSLPPAQIANADHDGVLKDVLTATTVTPEHMERTARKLARKTLTSVEPILKPADRVPTLHEKHKQAWAVHEQGEHGRRFYVARKTGRFFAEMGKAGLKAPVSLFWNTANGFHNFPSYGFAGIEVRRRDHITGFGSGCKAAGKEVVYGVYDAFSGIVVLPYKATRDEGAKGLPKGIWRAGKGFFSNLGAAFFGIPGYTLKGLEKELSKRHLTKLKAEIILIRMRLAISEWRTATPEQREDVVTRWKAKFA